MGRLQRYPGKAHPAGGGQKNVEDEQVNSPGCLLADLLRILQPE